MGSLLRAGLSLGIGATNPKPLPRDRNDYALWKSEIKLRFEEIRRRIAPDAVSRLNCLYLADNIEVIKGIPEFDPKAPIIKVRIRENSWVTKADMNWLADTADIQATEAKFAWHCLKLFQKII